MHYALQQGSDPGAMLSRRCESMLTRHSKNMLSQQRESMAPGLRAFARRSAAKAAGEMC